MQAGIAVAAMLRRLLAKIMQNGLAPAAGDFTKAEHGIELLALHAFVELIAGGAGQHLAQLDHILQAVGHPGGGGLTIAPGPAGFLIDRKSTRLNSSHVRISYAVFCLKKKKKKAQKHEQADNVQQ